MNPSHPNSRTEVSSLNRRSFLRTAATGVMAVSAARVTGSTRAAAAVPAATSETLVAALYRSLGEEQRKQVCFPFDHPLRSKVDNNWNITKPTVGGFFNRDQQQMIREIFLGLHSEEYAPKVMHQVEHDAGTDGFGACSVALFGEPGTGRFEFVLTGRHVTRRCDGDSVAGTAFGGPIFYGHAAQGDIEKPDHPGNVYWYQALRANEVFQSLDGKQRETALLGNSRGEDGTDTVKLTGRTRELPGIPVGALARDQRDLIRKVMADLLAPFRKPDATEAMKLVEQNGIENLHLAFYRNEDVGKDGVWDVWQIEGPAMLWYFRGKPHVHAWVHIRDHA